MISYLKVNGFKSLNNFTLRFNKGLNVLIGPNGAGKTNICQALGIIAAIADNSLSEYLLTMGGASAIHSTNCQIGEGFSNERLIEVSCIGETKLKKGNINLRYTYHFSIGFADDLYIKREVFRLSKLQNNGKYKNILSAHRRNKTDIVIKIDDTENLGPAEDILKEKKRQTVKLHLLDSLIGFLPFLSAFSFYCFLAREDMSFAVAWNIDPYLAKKPSDILETHRMLPDGRRLSNAIHELSKSDDESIYQINSLLSKILPGHAKIVPEFSKVSGVRTFHLEDSSGASCPAQSLSDGTVKILALLVGILSQHHSTSIIEEPENYLHPWACELLIGYFRDYFVDGVCLLTTHSETILNMIQPNELIIVEKINGYTKIRRIKHERLLVEAIRMSGFGCGYHYLAGSLGGIPK